MVVILTVNIHHHVLKFNLDGVINDIVTTYKHTIG